MKKLIYLLLFVFLPSASYAWIVNAGTNTKTAVLNPKEMIKNGTKFYTPDEYDMAYTWECNGFRVTGGTEAVIRFNDIKPTKSTSREKVSGLYLGTTWNGGTPSTFYNLCICTGKETNRIITKVSFDYVILSNDSEFAPIIKEHLGHIIGGSTWESLGNLYGDAIIEPYLPVSMIPITNNGMGTPSTDNGASPNFGNNAVTGCLITRIYVEYVELPLENLSDANNEYYFSLGQELEHLSQDGNYFKNRKNLMDQKKYLYQEHYAKTTASDVNGDGTVNSADVTNVYNAINSGESEVNGIQYVDLGLPSGNLWATMNYGAIVPEDFGDIYVFESTTGYLANNITTFTIEKYSENRTWYAPAPWIIPSEDDAKELLNNCTATTGVYINNVPCIVLTSNINGNQLILPGVSHIGYENGYYDGYYAQYWTSTNCTGNSEMFKTIGISRLAGDIGIDNDNDNCLAFYHGCYLRLVCPKQK